MFSGECLKCEDLAVGATNAGLVAIDYFIKWNDWHRRGLNYVETQAGPASSFSECQAS